MNHGSEIASLLDVTRSFETNGSITHAVRHVSLQLRPGELVLLLGPSGSGKTTLLTLLAGLQRPSAGIVTLFGKDVARCSPEELQQLRARRMGFVFQNFHLIDCLTVADNVRLVRHFAGRNGNPVATDTRHLLAGMNIAHLAARFSSTLSQGEKQRVAIARAIANDADLIIADEPTASLESRQGLDVIRQLSRLAGANGKCVVVASHDLRLKAFAHRVLTLRDGVIIHSQVRRKESIG